MTAYYKTFVFLVVPENESFVHDWNEKVTESSLSNNPVT